MQFSRCGIMAKTGFSKKTAQHSYMHFDNDGKCIGCSKSMSLSCDMFHYDENNQKNGYSHPAFFGGYIHYNNDGMQIGRSDPAPGGGFFHYDVYGKQTGYSVPAPLDGFIHYDV